MFFFQLLGGAIFTSVASNVLDNKLIQNLAGIPGVNPKQILNEGATSLLNGIPDSAVNAVLSAYNESLRTVFQIGLVMSCVVIFGAAAMEWRSVKSKKDAMDQKKKAQQEADVEATAGADAEKGKDDARSAETHQGYESSLEQHGTNTMADDEKKSDAISKAI